MLRARKYAFCSAYADKSLGDLDIAARQSMPVTSEKPPAVVARKSTATVVAVTLSGKSPVLVKSSNSN